MKKLILAATAVAFSTLLFAQPGKKTASDVARFTSETIDLGKIKQGNPTTGVFSIANIGSDPLIIEQASPTCGCTISDYTKEPIAPGKTGTIKATYNAANVGAFEKHLTVKFAGIDEIKSITLKGEVVDPNAVTTTPAVIKPQIDPVKTVVTPESTVKTKVKNSGKKKISKVKTKTKPAANTAINS